MRQHIGKVIRFNSIISAQKITGKILGVTNHNVQIELCEKTITRNTTRFPGDIMIFTPSLMENIEIQSDEKETVFFNGSQEVSSGSYRSRRFNKLQREDTIWQETSHDKE